MGKTLPYDTLDALRAKMIADHPTFGHVDYAPGAADAAASIAAALGADGKLSNEPLTSPITDFYLTNPIARASQDDGRVLAPARASAHEGGGGMNPNADYVPLINFPVEWRVGR